MANNQLIEWSVGVGFFVTNTMQHVGSTVWYFVAGTIEEAEVLLEEKAEKYCEKHSHGAETFEYSYEWLAIQKINQITWEPEGEPMQL